MINSTGTGRKWPCTYYAIDERMTVHGGGEAMGKVRHTPSFVLCTPHHVVAYYTPIQTVGKIPEVIMAAVFHTPRRLPCTTPTHLETLDLDTRTYLVENQDALKGDVRCLLDQ